MKEGLLVGKVRSTNGEKFYEIRKIRVGEWHCDCKAWQHARSNKQGKKFPCRHMRALWSAWTKTDIPEGIKFDARNAQAALAR